MFLLLVYSVVQLMNLEITYISSVLILGLFGILSSLKGISINLIPSMRLSGGLITLHPPGKIRTICKLLVQATFYVIWNERNKRLHTSVARHPQLIIKEIQVILKAKLYGLDQNVGSKRRIPSPSSNPRDRYLHQWFHNFPS